jgi:hypothetical protein
MINQNGIQYTYSIVDLDIDHSCLIVIYKPVDQSLPNRRLMVAFRERPLYDEDKYFHVDDIPFEEHLEYSIQQAAPVKEWRTIKILRDNFHKLKFEKVNG